LLRRLPILITHDYFCMILGLLHGRLATTVSLLPQRIPDSFYAPADIGWGHYALMTDVSLSVCLSVCPVPGPKPRTEGHMKLKIGGKEAHITGDPWPHLQIKRSKVKVTRPINAMTKNQLKFRRPTNFEVGTRLEYDDSHHRHAR